MSARRLAVLTSDTSHSRLIVAPATFGELVSGLEQSFDLSKNHITVLHVKSTASGSPLDEYSYQQALSDSSETLTLQAIPKHHFHVPTTEYLLTFTSRHKLSIFNLYDDFESHWESKHITWSGRACVLAEDKLIFTGGSSHPKAVYQYDVLAKTELQLQDMAVGRMWHGLCALGEAVYAVGGRSSPKGKALASAETFISGTWALLPELNTPRESLTLVAQLDAIFAIGGFDGLTRLKSIEKFEGEDWMTVSCELPEPRQMPGVVFTDDETMLVIGGQDDQSERSEVFELQLDSGEVKSLQPLPTSEFFTGRQVTYREDECIWAFGSHTYVLEGDSWTLRR